MSEDGKVQTTNNFVVSTQDGEPNIINSEWIARLDKTARLHNLTWLLSPTNIRINGLPIIGIPLVIFIFLFTVSCVERQISFGVVGIVGGVLWAAYVFKVEKLKADTGRAVVQGIAVLKTTEDKQSIGCLAKALHTSTHIVAQEIEYVLTRLLPTAGVNDSALLDAEARKSLYRAMNGNHNTKQEFVLAIIHCLRTIGDVDAVPALKRITAKNLGAASVNVPIYLAAENCLKSLESQWAEAQQSRTLVRASDAASVPGETLLRGVSNAQETSISELLHPSQPQEQETKND